MSKVLQPLAEVGQRTCKGDTGSSLRRVRKTQDVVQCSGEQPAIYETRYPAFHEEPFLGNSFWGSYFWNFGKGQLR